MAGDWIKMRGGLLVSPKVIALARILHGERAFRDWLTPGGGGPMNGQIVTDEALRCVTVALLLRVWSVAREQGKFVGEDLLMPCICVSDIDGIAGVSGFGNAMARVGWAKAGKNPDGVIFPNFKEHNVPMASADRQRLYRERKKSGGVARYGALHPSRNKKAQNVAPREEKRREENNKDNTPHSPPFPASLDTPKFRVSWVEWMDYRRKVKKKPLSDAAAVKTLAKLAKFGADVAVQAIEEAIANDYQGLFPEKIRPNAQNGMFAGIQAFAAREEAREPS